MGILSALANLVSRRPRQGSADPDAENNNERSSRDEIAEDPIGGEGEIIAEASIVTERETVHNDAEITSSPTGDVNGAENQTSQPGDTASELEEGDSRQEEREALRSLDEALGRDAISEGGSSIMEPAAALVPSPTQNKKVGPETGNESKTEAKQSAAVVSDSIKAERSQLSTIHDAAVATAPENSADTEETDEANKVFEQYSEKNDSEKNVESSPAGDARVEIKTGEVKDVAVGESGLDGEFRELRLKSDDSSSLGGISVDPRLDTGSGLDGLIPESPTGIDALEGAGSDDDSDYPDERNLPGMKNGAGYGKYSTFLTGKSYTDIQATPRSGDVTFRKSAIDEPLTSQISGKEASPLEMVISSKMAVDTQEELVSALNKVKKLQAKVSDVEKDVTEAQSNAFDARKEAMEAKNEAIKAKQEAAEAMEEAMEAKKDASQKRKDIQAISAETSHPLQSTTDTTNALSLVVGDVLGPNSLSSSTGTQRSLGFIPSGVPDSHDSPAAEIIPDTQQMAAGTLNRVSSAGSEAITQSAASVTSAVDSGVGTLVSESRDIAQEGRSMAGKVESGVQEVRSAATSLQSGLSFSSLWGEFLVRISLLLITIGAVGHLIVAIVRAVDDSSYIKLGVFLFILVCIFAPAACILIYLLVKSNVSALYKVTRQMNASSKVVHNPTVRFSDHVEELPPLNHHSDGDDGMEEISLGSRTSDRDTTPITQASDALQDSGRVNPAFENNLHV